MSIIDGFSFTEITIVRHRFTLPMAFSLKSSLAKQLRLLHSHFAQ